MFSDVAELKLITNKAEAKSLSASLMDDVMRHAGVSLDKMMGERLTKLKAIDEEVTEIKTKQMMDQDDIAKLRNENIMSQDLINGINIMVESLRFEGEQVKKKQGDIKKELA